MTSTEEEIRLLADLVAIPSPSGGEGPVASCAAAWCRAAALDVRSDDSGVTVELRGSRQGPTLALASHLDVVPAGEGWTRPPFDPVVEGGCLHGRGAGDAKGSVAAMLCAARDVAAAGGPLRGRLLVLLALGEESRAPSMPLAVERAGPIDAAVVGEPTGLDLAIAQRGLFIAELRARGLQRHAAHVAASDGSGAIETLARDLLRLHGLFDGRSHPVLGCSRATPTMLRAGIARNVTPPEAVATVDVRTTPDWTHEEVAATLRAALASEVEIVSDRLVPCEARPGSRLLAIARALRPGARTYGSPTCSDWVFLRHADALKCGPGDSDLSHRPDERILVAQVSEARRFYAALAREYLA